MSLRDEMIALIPNDLDETDKKDLLQIINRSIDLEKDTSDRSLSPEDLEGLE